jgi:enoyl-CoA hydratase/carnithine racemase
MTNPSYADRYENLAFSRDDNGVLTMRFHTNGGPIVFTGQTHEDLPLALEEVALDEDNRAMIITGTGDTFMDQIDGPSLGDMSKPVVFLKVRRQGIKILSGIPSLPFPVVGVANGPATVHSEYLLLTDIHIASERAIYGDLPHTTFGIAAGDGMQIVWEDLAGSARAKWLLWSGENIDAATAMQWGVVTEVLPHDKVMARGVEIATKLAARTPVYRQLQKETLNQRLIRRVAEAVPYGMALEGLTTADLAYQG